jgi:outer membrane autotransporter protein
MKTQRTKGTAHLHNKLSGILVAFITALFIFCVLPKAWCVDLFWTGNATTPPLPPATPANAGSGTWATFQLTGGAFSWSTTAVAQTGANWTDGSTANFVGTTGGTVTLATAISAAGINFGAGAGAFTISTDGNTLTIQSTGIANNSDNGQTIVNNGGAALPPPELTLGQEIFAAAFSPAGSTVFSSGTTITGNTTIINSGGTADGAPGGSTVFNGTSSAGTATLMSLGGTNGGLGGSTFFDGTSDGGTARAITNGNGSLDISGLTTAGMGIGSIEGSGFYFLGSKTLTVGGNNLSTTVSGVIQDGGDSGGAGGSLKKIGTGTLTLAGANTYTGITTINAGVLSISQDANLGTAPAAAVADQLTLNGGTLQATASFTLNANRGVTLNGGGGTFDVTAANLLTYDGVITGTGDLTKIGTGTLALGGVNTYTGSTTVNAGFLQASSAGAFSEASAFTVNTGAILDLNGFDNTVGSLSGSGLVTNSGGVGEVPSNAMLSVGADNSSTIFSGTLQDGGSTLALTKVGTGTLILTGTDTYTGGTTIAAGTLQLGNGGMTGSITGNVTDNSILAFDRSNALTFGGVISGTGAVQQIGTGTTVLLGDSNYAGGTTIQAGTLQLGNGRTTGSITGNVTDNGILAFDRSDVLTFDGVISGTGSVQQIGTGTTVLLGDSNYAGGTTINAGTLQLGKGGTTGSITGNITDNGNLAFDRSNDLTFGGVISGTGSVQQNGPGTTVLVGKNTYIGATTVNAGSLIVDGSIASVQTLVNPGGLLGGRGSIGSPNSNLVNSGVVRPGDSPGTLTVNNNYTQTAAGTLRIEVASVTEHGLLAVGGHASLAGALQLIGLGGFTLHVGDQFTFLTANGGVSGTFGTVQNEISTGTVVQAQVVTLPNAVLLEGAQGSFVQAACNPNSAAVARALDSAVGNPRASALIAFLNDQAFNNLCGDFTLIAPEALASIFDAGVSFANVQTANLKRRLEDVRAGDNGFNSSGFSLNGGTSNFSPGLAGVTGPEGKSGPSVMAPTPENRWGIWVTGLGEFANVSSTNEAAGFDIQTGGVTFGVDYRVCSIFAVGLTAGYANMNADLPNGGSLDVNSGQFGLYATLFGKGFYADAAITGGPSGYDSRRAALLGSANGNTGGANFNVLAAVGYDWTKGGLSVGPTANFQYTYVGISGFTESGSIAPLNIDSQNVESERTAIGMKASYEWKVGHVIIKPEISAAWQHEFGDQSYTIVSSFANGAGNSFTVSSPSIGRDSLLIGAGTAVLLNDRLSIYAYYDGELLRTNYQSNDVSAGVRLTF